MKLGLFAGYWGLGITGAEQLEMAQEADRLGYDSVWAAEAYGNDAATVLAWLASNTENDAASRRASSRCRRGRRR